MSSLTCESKQQYIFPISESVGMTKKVHAWFKHIFISSKSTFKNNRNGVESLGLIDFLPLK